MSIRWGCDLLRETEGGGKGTPGHRNGMGKGLAEELGNCSEAAQGQGRVRLES